MTADEIIDCHAHVIDPGRFAYADGPGYRPQPHETGTREAFNTVLDAHGVKHVLLVQPSCYGTDNSAMLDAVAREPGRLKAIAVVAPDITDKALAALAARGVVGVRFNLVSYDGDALTKAATAGLLDRLKAADMFAQIYAHDQQWPALEPVLRQHGVKVLIDHFGVRDISAGVAAAGFQAVLELGRRGNAAVKLSAPFRLAASASGYRELDAFAEGLLSAFGIGRCVWGSDWPFLAVSDRIDYAELPATIMRWLPDPADRKRVLWANPVRLFGFGA
ncbi:MAG TPA: amidohydrolase family protein [Candidatus Angelobacter sp.]|nr:amidohydrolase family protein [Candidatus Angelobacter sp.]